MRVLVVEDDKNLREQLSGALTDAGYTVDTADNGEDGQFLGETEPYDLAILDLGLPKVDGLSVLKAWRKDGRAMPVLILSARDRWSEKVEGLDLGANDYVTVSSLGDAKSLLGGTLLMTQLQGADGQVYAVAQGGISVSGFVAEGEAESVSQGVATTGRIPNGALVEQVVPGHFDSAGPIVLELRNPDFGTVVAITDAINDYTSARYGIEAAREDNARQVTLFKPAEVNAARFVAEIGELRVTPDTPARVVIDERTGTVVIGSNVQISPVAVTHGTLTVRITESPVVSQPGPLSDGETAVVPRTEVDAEEPEASLAIVGGTDLQMLVRGLNQIGLKPTGIMAILQAIKSAGALQADLVLQ